MNSPSIPGRGWVWGIQGATPTAALENSGVMQLAKSIYTGPYMYNTTSIGKVSASGTGAEFTLTNRAATSFVVNPSNGERWAIYSDGPVTDGKFNIWSGANFFTIKKDGKTGIGLDNPTARLEVAGSGGSTIDFKVNGRMLSTGGGLFVDNTQTLFVGASAPGKIGFYNNTAWRMVVDNAGNVGVGTESPTSKLEVYGNGGGNVDMKVRGRITTGDASLSGGVWMNSAQTMFIGQATTTALGLYNNGAFSLVADNMSRIGIGVNTPTARLDVAGLGAGSVDFKVNGRMKTGDGASTMGGVFVNNTETMLVGQYDASKMGFFNNGAWRLITDSNGNVGIGTLAPDALLAVKGTVHAREVKVDMAGAVAPDYVFEKNYKLPSLDDIKSYINQHHHLPEVPSAKELEENGMNVGEMNLTLLKKIEELTLYIIEQEERIQALENRKN